MIRQEFLDARQLRALNYRASDTVRQVLINFGGGECSRYVRACLNALHRVYGESPPLIKIVVGSSETLYEVRNQIEQKLLSNVQLYSNVDNMAALMVDCDYAIGAAGTSAWERCCLGLPSVIFCMAPNQEMIAQHLEQEGAALLTVLDEQEIVASIKEMSSIERRHVLSEKGKMLCDGLGVARVVSILLGQIPVVIGGSNLVLRTARSADASSLLEWRNDPDTRKASHTTQEIAYQEHLEWFDSVLENPERILLIAEEKGVPVGSVRADPVEDGYKLSWMIAPEARGRGLAKLLVSQVSERVAAALYAEVRVDNDASNVVARRAGFTLSNTVDGVNFYHREALC